MCFHLVCIGGYPAVVAESPSPGPVGLGGRVELPEYGFGLTFPDDWVWMRYTPEEDGSVTEQLGSVMGLPYALVNADIFSVVDTDTPLLAHGRSRVCVVKVATTLLPLEAVVDEYLAFFRGQPGSFAGAMSTDISLPAGPAMRIDVDYEDPLMADSGALFLLVRGDRLYRLGCDEIDDPPADGWLSIAETFELLPEQ